MRQLCDENINGMAILEVGTGRGGTTRELVKMVAAASSARLVTTDRFGGHFASLEKEFANLSADVRFIETDATELRGIADRSMDIVVCNYTLCAINSHPGHALRALKRMYDVLKTDGILYLREEFPLFRAANPRQAIWAKKWRLLRACELLLGELPYNEIEPEVVAEQLELLQFQCIQLDTWTEAYEGEEALDFFAFRLAGYMKRLPTDDLKAGIEQMAAELQDDLRRVGAMEVPSYQIRAVK